MNRLFVLPFQRILPKARFIHILPNRHFLQIRQFHRWDKGQYYYRHQTLTSSLFLVAGITATSFLAAAIYDYEYNRRRIIIRGQNFANWFSKKTSSSNNELKAMVSDLSDGQKVTYAITAINVAVFLLWKLPGAYTFMLKFFTNSPSTPPFTLLTSAFSHSTPLHLLFNMLALCSIGSWLIDSILGKEQFLALYTSAVIFSHFCHDEVDSANILAFLVLMVAFLAKINNFMLLILVFLIATFRNY